MPCEHDHLPRIFQANVDRLYLRVIRTCLELLPSHDDVLIDGPASEAAALVRLAAQVDNHTAEEARRAFVLVLAGTFERQIRYWSAMVLTRTEAAAVARRQLPGLIDRLVQFRNMQLAPGVRDTIDEMLLVANVVRHGDGRSSDALRVLAPRLWFPSADTFDQAMPASGLASDGIRIAPGDLCRYASTLLRFWGTADTLPKATITPPY